MNREMKMLAGLVVVLVFGAMLVSGCAEPLKSGGPAKKGDIVIQSALAENEDALKAGKTAAEALKKALGNTAPKVVLVTDCFDDKALKTKALKGVISVFSKDIVIGFAGYGSFTQGGAKDTDTVGVLGIGGDGIDVQIAFVKNMGAKGLSFDTDKDKLTKALGDAGRSLAKKLTKKADSRLLIAIPDAHSPKNQLFMDGLQDVVGKDFPITGGSISKNDGETFLHYQGTLHSDSAIAIMLSGDFKVGLAGRQAKTNDAVIATAKSGAAEALKNLGAKPIAMIAFDCAGRKGKLDNLEDELKAFQGVTGKDITLFGCYCAGEFGPADVKEKKPGVVSSGMGWHAMITFIGR
ncbi:MAG: FIST C-terminal domain-containing protein [Phycisphaerae bacterium]|nr:FIST C-terminal domain-containing protein [Phycisphaerae bacterium]